MNDIIRNIEAAQMKADVTDFRVGDTIKVFAKVKEQNYFTSSFTFAALPTRLRKQNSFALLTLPLRTTSLTAQYEIVDGPLLHK